MARVNLNLCESCLEKQRTIDRLQQEIQSLREQVYRVCDQLGIGWGAVFDILHRRAACR